MYDISLHTPETGLDLLAETDGQPLFQLWVYHVSPVLLQTLLGY